MCTNTSMPISVWRFSTNIHEHEDYGAVPPRKSAKPPETVRRDAVLLTALITQWSTSGLWEALMPAQLLEENNLLFFSTFFDQFCQMGACVLQKGSRNWFDLGSDVHEGREEAVARSSTNTCLPWLFAYRPDPEINGKQLNIHRSAMRRTSQCQPPSRKSLAVWPESLRFPAGASLMRLNAAGCNELCSFTPTIVQL